MKEVVLRKFPHRAKDVETFFQSLPSTMVRTPKDFDATEYPVMRDEGDLPILVTALQENIDVLISGDKDFTTLKIEKPKILTPTEFLKIYG
jgi:predicted nucleic acid-binding protein